MGAVLGIDAAWTATNPSGVALVVNRNDGWDLVALAHSIGHFLELANPLGESEASHLGSRLSAKSLLSVSLALCGHTVDIVAVDMPLAMSPITCRRASDNMVSRAYGGRKCGTHTPSAIRPGRISDNLREEFEQVGYPLLTSLVSIPGLVEVYPHPALVELAGASERLPYKVANVGKYWRSLSPLERRVRLYKEWKAIVVLLERQVRGVAAALPDLSLSASSKELKGYEDMLDAVVCAWVGICVIEGRANPFGDQESAIWVPLSQPR